MARKKTLEIAKPTIAEVLEQFLADQAKRLAAGTLAQYENIVGLLEDCLNGYASNSLDKAEEELFDRHYNARGTKHREFCEVFGPEHILSNVGEFLGYFMIRKVMAGKDTLRAAGTVTKKLAKWLAEKGYVEAEEAEFPRNRAATRRASSPRRRIWRRTSMISPTVRNGPRWGARSKGTSPSRASIPARCGLTR